MVLVVPVNTMKDIGGCEVYTQSALCWGRVTGQLLAMAVLLYDIKLPFATEDEYGWAPKPVWKFGRIHQISSCFQTWKSI
jgi:hypothetical protein